MSNKKDKLMLAEYQRAINRIDDYFEYRHESEKDKQHVVEVLDNLTDQLREIQNGTKST